MHAIDWMLVTLPLLICGAIAIYSRQYVRSVADFMAGGRNAGRYLICAARSEQGAGAAVFVAVFQGFFVAGFVPTWWGFINVPVGLLVAITGFVIYRYRETRAMTLGQFFEMRYSRKFRLFTGMLGFFAGILNFGIIPVIGAKFMVFFLDFPHAVNIFGLAVPSYLLLMALFLTIEVITTTTGGQVSVLLTDCAEGMFSQFFFTFIAVMLLIFTFKWGDTRSMLLATKPNHSLVNPWDAWGVKNFNLWLVLMGTFSSVYRSIAWQNSHAFNSSAATPHESRMGSILGKWRSFASGVMVTLLAVCAMTYANSAAGSKAVSAVLATVMDPSTRDQMRVAVTLSLMLPIGIKGALVSVMLMGIIAGDGIHLHSWGSIFVQDVAMPVRQLRPRAQEAFIFTALSVPWGAIGVVASGSFAAQPWLSDWLIRTFHGPAAQAGALAAICVAWGLVGALCSRRLASAVRARLCDGELSPKRHLLLLRFAIVGVALWAFTFGALFPQMKYVMFWWAITEAIFIGGAGIAVIGGLYWSRGTSPGAWAGLIVGSSLSFAGIAGDLYCRLNGTQFFLDGPQVGFFSGLAAILTYGIVSFITCRRPHNMDKLLHRGQFAVASDQVPVAHKRRGFFSRIVGIDGEFSRSDRWITYGIFWWSIGWFGLFIVGSLGYMLWARGHSDKIFNGMWANFWYVTAILLPVLIGFITTVWFTIGCWHDMWIFFRRLREEKIDIHDDGSVKHAETPAQGNRILQSETRP